MIKIYIILIRVNNPEYVSVSNLEYARTPTTQPKNQIIFFHLFILVGG